jgi:hypothetical protein
VELHADLIGTVLGSINSRLELAGPSDSSKDLRRWEYGPSRGARAEALLLVGAHPVVQAKYRYQWIHVSNDTLENGGVRRSLKQLLQWCPATARRDGRTRLQPCSLDRGTLAYGALDGVLIGARQCHKR